MKQARILQRTCRACAVAAALVLLGTWESARAIDLKQIKPTELFQVTNIWTVHLKFTADQWEAMQPKQPQGGGFGGRNMFSPGGMLTPKMIELGDEDGNGKLSEAELKILGAKWFDKVSGDKGDKLTSDQLASGMTSWIFPPNAGMRMNLQGAPGKRNGVASMMGWEFEYARADVDFAGQPLKNVAVRYKGNGTFLMSQGTHKKSLKLDLNEFTKGQKIGEISKLNLHSCVTDASWMNEVLSHRLFRDAGVPAPRTAYARVYVTVPEKHNNEYFGLYSLVENIDSNFAEEHYGTRKGAIFKPVSGDMFAYMGEDWARYKQTFDPKEDVTPEQAKHVIDFCKLVTKADDAEFAAKLGDFVDLEEFSRYTAVLVWLAELDGILGTGQNFYLYLHPKTQKLQFLPWDMDHSFGQFAMRGTQEQRENLSIHKPWQGEIRFLERIFKVPAFKSLYLARLEEFNKTLFKPERLVAQVDELAAILRNSVKEESEEKVASFDKVVAGESVAPAFGRMFARQGGPGGPGNRGGGPGGPPPGFNFPQTKPIKTFAKVRAQSVADQLAGKSEGQTLGEFSFGPPRGGGGPGGPGGRPGGPGGNFGPGSMFGSAFMGAFDADQDKSLTRDEAAQGFVKWAQEWKSGQLGELSEDELREGLNQKIRFGPPPGQ